jgi:hypothetical protein
MDMRVGKADVSLVAVADGTTSTPLEVVAGAVSFAVLTHEGLRVARDTEERRRRVLTTRLVVAAGLPPAD